VLGQDTAIELGNPKDASTACLLWVNDPGKVNNSRITIVGPDVPQLQEQHISFGKVVIVGGKDFNEENSYDRYREMEHLRYDIHLKGYMMRGVSQYQREWSRISKMAVNNGFSFQVLGGALIDKFFELKYVRAVETIFITSGKDDVLAMKNISDNVVKIIGAMNKMAEEMSFDCDSCEYTEVCSDVAELRSMRRSNKSKGAAANA
jgi:CO dehydrogenase/acetyl-CoA synthase beta subunit